MTRLRIIYSEHYRESRENPLGSMRYKVFAK